MAFVCCRVEFGFFGKRELMSLRRRDLVVSKEPVGCESLVMSQVGEIRIG